LRNATTLQPDDFTPRLNYGIALLEAKNAPPPLKSNCVWPLERTDLRGARTCTLGVALIGLDAIVRSGTGTTPRARSSGVAASDFRITGWAGYIGSGHEYARAASELEQYLELVPNAPNADRNSRHDKGFTRQQRSPKQ
jgi:hypothetical protein